MIVSTGIILILSTIIALVFVNTEEIDLLEDLNRLPEVRRVIQHQTMWGTGRYIWSLNFTDVGKRELFLSPNRTREILHLINKNDKFGICVMVNQNQTRSGTLFSIIHNNKERIFEITILLKKKFIKILYSANSVERKIKIRVEHLSNKTAWHYLCIEYSSTNKMFTLRYDCNNELKRSVSYSLPKTELPLSNLSDCKIWIGQRTSKRGYFEGVVKNMIFFSNSNYISAFCDSVFERAVTMPVDYLLDIGSVTSRLMIIEKEIYNLQMKLKKSENDPNDTRHCQCFPLCFTSKGEKKGFSETWQDNSCRNCTCTYQGTKCDEEKCPNLTCPNRVTDQGKCCQRCGRICQYQGKNYTHKEIFKINCLKCQCNDGSLNCSRINPKLECKKLTCNRFFQVKIPGQCCKICKKINLCDFNNCGVNAICKNSSTFFTCQCKSGYEGNPYQRCEDIDECRNQNICPKSTECVNTEGSYTCVCKPGYVRTNSSTFGCIATCIKNKCKNNSSCIAPDKCECAAGYSGPECETDINECNLGLIKCPANSECLNIPGSYICRCVNGFRSTKSSTLSIYYDHQCEDINECHGRRGIDYFCNDYSTCVNTPGGYECILNDTLFEENSCEIEYRSNSKIMEKGKEYLDSETCKQCLCSETKISCFYIKCNCSTSSSKFCCRKCFRNECDSSSLISVKNTEIQGFTCMVNNSTCPDKECPKIYCHDSIDIPGQCCKFCRSDHITSCILEYNKFASSSAVSNHFIPSCFYKDSKYKNGEKFIFNHHMDGSCTKCLCWNQNFCCAKSFDCQV